MQFTCFINNSTFWNIQFVFGINYDMVEILERMQCLYLTKLGSFCKYATQVILVAFIVWPGWRSLGQSKQDVVMQILVPYQSTAETAYQNTHVIAKQTIKYGHERIYENLRKNFEINSWLNFTETESPAEILSLFCTEIFTKHVNTILSLNHGSGTESSNNYILQLAEHLGYPVISWDPHYPGALQSIENSRVLQIAPTIYHQCQAMTRLLSRYNWTEFSIITSKITSHADFINCMRDMVKRTSTTQGFITTAKFKLLSTITVDIDDYDDDEDKKATVTAALQTVIRTVTRVVLLHAESNQALDILQYAGEMGLTEAKYMWLLTSSSIGRISRMTRLPVGTLGIMYNDSREMIERAMTTSLKIWALGLEMLASNPASLNRMKMFPTNACNASKQSYWNDGEHIYRAMKRVVMTDPPVSFTDNGIIENVELKIYNVRPLHTNKPTRRIMNTWDLVGNILPKKVGDRTEMRIEMDEVMWPGGAVYPPKGKPDKRLFRIVTLKEPPYIDYVKPNEETGMCTSHSVPCQLNKERINQDPDLYGNVTVKKNGMVDFCCTGLCVDLLDILSKRMSFDFEMYEVQDLEWGIQNEEGNWTGLIKDMLAKRADMVITSIKINHQRAQAIDFSTPFLETGITIMVALRKGAISATAFLEPFDKPSWLLVMLLCIPVVASAIFTTEWLSPVGLNRGMPYDIEPYDYPSWCLILVFSVHATGASIFIFEWMSPSGLNKGKSPLREHKFSLFRSFWLIWAMLFGASVTTDNPRGMSSRFLANVWALFALVFLASYTANLAAFMITIDEYYDLSGIQDWRLLNPTAVTPHFRFATVPGGSTEDNLRKNYPRMHRYMQKYNKTTVDEGVLALKRAEIHAFIYDATVLEYRTGRDPKCDLITVGKWYAMTGYGVGFPKGSPYIEEVNEIILDLQNNGELDRLQKFWLAGACHARKDKKDKTSHNIGILNFTSAFILLATGVLLGTILLLLEHCYFKFGRKCLKKYDKSGCCSLVSLSMGKSLTFEQSVIDTIDYHRRHRCKDALCETQLWKAKHELDIALLNIDRLRQELSEAEPGDRVERTTTLDQENDAKTIKPNGTSIPHTVNIKPESHYEIPDNVRKRQSNHIDHIQAHINGKADYGMAKSIDNKNTIDNNDIELSDVDIKRLQFRRSPSYTNAMSTDSDGKEGNDGGGGGGGGGGSGGVLSKPPPSYSTCESDASPKRASYSQAVEDSPVLYEEEIDSPKQNTRTRFYDGKYYVGVAGVDDDSAL